MFGNIRGGRRAATLCFGLGMVLAVAQTSHADEALIVDNAGEALNSPARIAGLFDFLQRGPSLLQVPVVNASFSSGFGMRRNPVLGGWRLHAGVDWSAPRGSAILAAGDGVVLSAEWENGYGYTTRILHEDGVETMYAHQSAIAQGVVPGARVRQGAVIGAVGATGSATGPHLHYEVRINGELVDPLGAELQRAALVGG